MNALATFAGGCFWCMEPPFAHLKGVKKVYPGYSGGNFPNPSYEQVSGGETDHRESIQIEYDPEVVNYETLIDTFWRNIDPTDRGGQFADRGRHYQTAVFYRSEEERKIAERSKKDLESSGQFREKIVTEILPFTVFYPAEGYHHGYYRKNPLRYKLYKQGSGRERFLEETWGK